MILGQLMMKDLNILKVEKIAALGKKISKLTLLKKKAIDSLQKTNETADSELGWWNSFKTTELKRLLVSSAESQFHLSSKQLEISSTLMNSFSNLK